MLAKILAKIQDGGRHRLEFLKTIAILYYLTNRHQN